MLCCHTNPSHAVTRITRITQVQTKPSLSVNLGHFDMTFAKPGVSPATFIGVKKHLKKTPNPENTTPIPSPEDKRKQTEEVGKEGEKQVEELGEESENTDMTTDETSQHNSSNPSNSDNPDNVPVGSDQPPLFENNDPAPPRPLDDAKASITTGKVISENKHDDKLAGSEKKAVASSAESAGTGTGIGVDQKAILSEIDARIEERKREDENELQKQLEGYMLAIESLPLLLNIPDTDPRRVGLTGEKEAGKEPSHSNENSGGISELIKNQNQNEKKKKFHDLLSTSSDIDQMSTITADNGGKTIFQKKYILKSWSRFPPPGFREQHACVVIQRAVKLWLGRRMRLLDKVRSTAAARRIQTAFRRHQAEASMKRIGAVAIIARKWKRYKARKSADLLNSYALPPEVVLKAVLRLQSLFRMRLARKRAILRANVLKEKVRLLGLLGVRFYGICYISYLSVLCYILGLLFDVAHTDIYIYI